MAKPAHSWKLRTVGRSASHGTNDDNRSNNRANANAGETSDKNRSLGRQGYGRSSSPFSRSKRRNGAQSSSKSNFLQHLETFHKFGAYIYYSSKIVNLRKPIKMQQLT